MNSLTIITTYPSFLPEGEFSVKGLFSEQSCIVQTATALKVFGRDGFSRRGNELIFAIQCLDKDHDNDAKIDKTSFIKAIFQDVLDSLTKEERNKINEVYYFGHSYDLGSTTASIVNMGTHELLKDTMWLKVLFGRDIILGTGELQKAENDSSVSVYFTSFSHEPHVSICKVLNKVDSEEDLPPIIGKLAKYLVRGAWVLDKEQKIQDLKTRGFEDIDFEYLYWSNEQFKSTDSNFIWQTSIKDKIEGTGGGQKVKLVFLPVVSLSEQMDKTIYEAVRKQLSNESIPVVFIGYWDIMKQEKGDFSKYYSLDRRYRFLDSSIWFRYIAIEGDFWTNLHHALETIRWAYDNRLYQKNVCQEFREFQLRLVCNSYLEEKFGSGHAKRVFPFTFHSETDMQSKAENTISGLMESELRWNVLLVDDFAGTSLKEESAIGQGSTKGEIIKNFLYSAKNNVSNASAGQLHQPFSQFDCKMTIQDAVNALGCGENQNSTSATVYDIILLDYLFSNPFEAKAQEHPYGTALLDFIHNTKRLDGIGVMQSYWIYPISVFNEAIQSHLQEKGYQYMEKRWQLSRGADPLNTPHLFRRSLFKFMEAQASKVQFDEKDIWAFMAKEDTFLLKKDEKSETKGLFLDRSKAVVAFRQFTERFSIEEGLPQHSALAESVREKLSKSGTKDLRDHLSQLLYLLGFSVGFDFPIIEQEFKAVKASFQGYKSLNIASRDEIKQIEKSMEDLSIAVYSIHGKYY